MTLLVSGCGDTMTNIKRGLGMEKVVPDEFAVTAAAPLAIPPDYTLRPPRPGVAPTQQLAPVEQARQTVFRASDTQLSTLPPATADRSPAEDQLLKQAGAGAAPRNIRDLVNGDANSVQDADSFANKLLFWRDSKPELAPNDQVIDASAEADRMRTAAAAQAQASSGTAAKPVAAAGGAGTPTIERTKSSGWFGWLF
jgi:hypothetical protein